VKLPRVKLRAVDLSFLDTAPKRWTFEARLHAPPDAVFAAISGDPATWTWFPGMTSGRYEGEGPHGVGSRRVVRQGPSVYHETIIAWDTPRRWVYRVDQMTVPLAKALVEEWVVEPAGPGESHTPGSVVRWRFAIDPRALFKALGPVAGGGMGSVFRRAMRNLDRTLGRTQGGKES